MRGVMELRAQRRLAMRGVPERLGLSFADGNIEMRAKPNGTAAGSNFEFRGYAAVYSHWFPMWDPHGEPYEEEVRPGASKRSLGNPNLDVPFLIGHNDAGIPLARTKSGTMRLSEDSHGTEAHVPAMDGRREEVRALASAVERGDMDEMSLAFVCTRQEWDPQFERRSIVEWDLHRGDVCAVVHGANPATAGARMWAAEQLSYRRPVAIGGPRLLEVRLPTQPYSRGAGEGVTCPQCRSGNDADARFCDQCGTGLQATQPYEPDPSETQLCPSCGAWQAPDAKVCDQCGHSLVNDHDADDGYNMMMLGGTMPLERLAQMSTADINDLPDSAFAYIEPGGKKDAEGRTTPRSLRHFPVHDAAHVRNALARAPQSPFGSKAMPKILAAAKKFGIDTSGAHAAAVPLERRASAAEDIDLASAPDYDATYAASQHAGSASHSHQHAHADGTVHTHDHAHPVASMHDHSHGTSASVMVDGSTGIPGDEQQMAAARVRERRLRELELEELAALIPAR